MDRRNLRLAWRTIIIRDGNSLDFSLNVCTGELLLAIGMNERRLGEVLQAAIQLIEAKTCDRPPIGESFSVCRECLRSLPEVQFLSYISPLLPVLPAR